MSDQYHADFMYVRSVRQAAELAGVEAAATQKLLDSDFSHRLLDDTKKVVWQVSTFPPLS